MTASGTRFTAAEAHRAVDSGLTTWERVIAMLRDELHIPDGAIEAWRRSGDREIAAVLVEWVKEQPQLL